MHELAIARRVTAIIEAKAAEEVFRAVKAVRIEVGPFSCVEPQALCNAFAVAARGTRAEGSRLEFGTIPADGLCPECGSHRPVWDYFAQCEDCSAVLEISGGDSLKVARLEVI